MEMQSKRNLTYLEVTCGENSSFDVHVTAKTEEEGKELRQLMPKIVDFRQSKQVFVAIGNGAIYIAVWCSSLLQNTGLVLCGEGTSEIDTVSGAFFT